MVSLLFGIVSFQNCVRKIPLSKYTSTKLEHSHSACCFDVGGARHLLSLPPSLLSFSSHEPATIMAASQASSAVPNGNGYETGSSAFEAFGRWVVFFFNIHKPTNQQTQSQSFLMLQNQQTMCCLATCYKITANFHIEHLLETASFGCVLPDLSNVSP